MAFVNREELSLYDRLIKNREKVTATTDTTELGKSYTLSQNGKEIVKIDVPDISGENIKNEIKDEIENEISSAVETAVGEKIVWKEI